MYQFFSYFSCVSLSLEEQFKPSTAPGGHYKPKIDLGGMENPKNDVNSDWHLHGTDNPHYIEDEWQQQHR